MSVTQEQKNLKSNNFCTRASLNICFNKQKFKTQLRLLTKFGVEINFFCLLLHMTLFVYKIWEKKKTEGECIVKHTSWIIL